MIPLKLICESNLLISMRKSDLIDKDVNPSDLTEIDQIEPVINPDDEELERPWPDNED